MCQGEVLDYLLCGLRGLDRVFYVRSAAGLRIFKILSRALTLSGLPLRGIHSGTLKLALVGSNHLMSDYDLIQYGLS